MKDIKFLPFEEITRDYEACSDLGSSVENFVSRYKVKTSWEWLGPQLLAHLGKYTYYRDPKEFLKHNIGRDPRELGIYRMMIHANRSLLMSQQTKKEHLQVCSLVPIYLAAQKKFNDVAFSSWNKDGLEMLVGKPLYEAMTAPKPLEELDNVSLLQLRVRGLQGKNKLHNPVTYHTLYNLQDTPIAHLPPLAKVMLTQIWCAHPLNRHKYMILDPYDWDHIPDPIIDVESTSTTELPWYQ